MKITDPIVIFGCPRSGTTFVARLIGSHNQVGYLEESRLIYTVAQAPYRPLSEENLKDLLIATYVNRELQPRDMDFNGGKYLQIHHLAKTQTTVKKYGKIVPADYIKRGVKRLSHLPAVEVLKKIFEEFSRELNVDKIVEKTNVNRYCLNFVKNVFPGAKMVSIIRDPRDLRASQKNWHHVEVGIKEDHMPLENMLEDWRRFVKSLERHHSYMIRYENLVNNFWDEVQKMLDFCGLDIDNGVIQYSKTEQGCPHMLSVGRHVFDITTEERARIENELSEEMETYGYSH